MTRGLTAVVFLSLVPRGQTAVVFLSLTTMCYDSFMGIEPYDAWPDSRSVLSLCHVLVQP